MITRSGKASVGHPPRGPFADLNPKRRLWLCAIVAALVGGFFTGVMAQTLLAAAWTLLPLTGASESWFVDGGWPPLLWYAAVVPCSLMGAHAAREVVGLFRYRIAYRQAYLALLVGQYAGTLVWLGAFFSIPVGLIGVGASAVVVGVSATMMQKPAAQPLAQ